MKTNTVFLFFFLLIIGACSHTNNDAILGTWKGIKLENTTIDSFFIKSQHLIDTMGKKNTPDENFVFYGTYNMDSLRQAMQLQNDSAKLLQYNGVYKTIFRFDKDKIAYVSFNDNAYVDTSKWNFDDEGALILEDLTTYGHNALIRMKILSLNDSLMELKIFNNNDSSKITFRHVAK